MAPKGKSPKPMTKQKTSADLKKEAAAPEPDGGEEGASSSGQANTAAPTNREEVLALVQLDGLPHCPTEQIIDLLKGPLSYPRRHRHLASASWQWPRVALTAPLLAWHLRSCRPHVHRTKFPRAQISTRPWLPFLSSTARWAPSVPRSSRRRA